MRGDIVFECRGFCSSGSHGDSWAWLAAGDDETVCSRCGTPGKLLTAAVYATGDGCSARATHPEPAPDFPHVRETRPLVDVLGPAEGWPAPYMLLECSVCGYQRVGLIDEGCPACVNRVADIVTAQAALDRRHRRAA